MFFWLKQRATKEKIEALEEKQQITLRVDVDRASGRRYIDMHTVDVGDMTVEVSEELEELVEKVTARDRVAPAYTEGIYFHWGTLIVVKNEGNKQLLMISGPSVTSVNVTYSLFRQKKLAPEESWGV